MLQAPGWRPIPRLATFHLLEPLFLHHLLHAGLEERLVFRARAPGAAAPPSFEQLALSYYRTRNLERELLDIIRSANAGAILLIKGAALAPLYPSPALRQMCDVDVVVARSAVGAIASALERSGWHARRHRSSEVWEHGESGMLLDLQVPGGKLGNEIFASAVPHPAFDADAGVLLPRPEHHLVLIAQHAAHHGGDRLWRDVCDCQVFLERDGGRRTAILAQEFAERHGVLPPTVALLRFINEHCHPSSPIPFVYTLTSRQEADRRRHQSLYEQLACDAIAPVALSLLRLTVRPLREHLRSAMHSLPSSTLRGKAAWAEADPQIGTLPAAGTLARQLVKVRLLMELCRNRQLGRYLRLARLQGSIHRDKTIFLPRKITAGGENR